MTCAAPSYERLRRTPLQWPVPPLDAPAGEDDRHPVRYLNDGVSQDLFVDADGRRPRLAFATPSRRAVFHARPHMDAAELPDDDYPMVLNTGRLQHQWHTMTKTGKVDKLNRLNPAPFVEIHPLDALELDIVEGQPVELASRRGRAVLPAVVSDRVRPGNCFAPFHWNDEHGEYLTVERRDQRRRRRGFVAAGVQGVCRQPASGPVCRRHAARCIRWRRRWDWAPRTSRP